MVNAVLGRHSNVSDDHAVDNDEERYETRQEKSDILAAWAFSGRFSWLHFLWEDRLRQVGRPARRGNPLTQRVTGGIVGKDKGTTHARMVRKGLTV
jgi:hypothetical protein